MGVLCWEALSNPAFSASPFDSRVSTDCHGLDSSWTTDDIITGREKGGVHERRKVSDVRVRVGRWLCVAETNLKGGYDR